MRLLVGLGNPGTKYERTRHNVGFRIAREAAEKLGIALDQNRWHALLGTGRVKGEQIAVMLPQTYMNASGESVGHAVRFWKVEPGALVVAHDELDLELGRIQVKLGGGVEMSRTRVIAKSGPQLEHVLERRCSERAHIRPAGSKAREIRRDRLHGGLLQHDLGEPDAVRIGALAMSGAPRQHAAVPIVPGEQRGRIGRPELLSASQHC